jgi:hypothetical protein
MIKPFKDICKKNAFGVCVECLHVEKSIIDCCHEYYASAIQELIACENCDHAQFDSICGSNDCLHKDHESLDKNSFLFCKNYKHTFKEVLKPRTDV